MFLGAVLAVSACSGDDGDDDDGTFVRPDSGVVRDAGPTTTRDAGPAGRDGGPNDRDGGTDRDAGTPRDGGVANTPSAMINNVRVAPPGMLNPALRVEGVTVTYVRTQLGDDPAGFFVQADMEGPALFVAVDTATLTATPAIGDEVSFDVIETEVVDGQHRVVAIDAFSIDGTGANVATLVQDLSAATDVVTALDSYESELVTADGTLMGTYAFAGDQHRRIGFSTVGLPDDPGAVFRVAEALILPLGLVDGCDVSVGPIPLWRFTTTAQYTVRSEADVTVTACAGMVQVVGARAINDTTVEVTFNRPLAAGTAVASAFVFSPAVTVASVAVNANVATLTVPALTPLQQYTITVDAAVTDDLSNSVDPAANTAMFTAPSNASPPSAVGDVVISEIMQNPAAFADSEGEYFEVYNPTAGPFDLSGCTVSDENADNHVVTQPILLPAGGYVTLARSSSVGFVPSYIYGADINLGNGSDRLVVVCSGVEIDRVEWDNGATFPDPNGASMNLDPSALTAVANDVGTNWCESVSAFGADRGTPNAANDTCPTAPRDGGVVDSGTPDSGTPNDAGTTPDAGPTDAGPPRDGGPMTGTPQLVINEVDYDQINTDDAEFVEIYNAGTAAASLANISVVLVNGSNDTEYNRVSLAAGGTLAAGGYIVVGPTGLAVPGGVTLVTFTGATNNIQNGSPDAVALIDDAANTLIDALSYEGSITAATITGFAAPVNLVEGTATAAEDSNSVDGSLVRLPNGTDTNDASADWAMSTTPSPGAAN